MKSLFVLILLISATSFAESTTWNLTYSDGQKAVLEIHDNPNTVGEEFLYFKLAHALLGARADVSKNGYEANIVITDSTGETLTDWSLSISFGNAYNNIKELLKEESFKKTFDFLSLDCDGKDKGFLMINDNINMTMTGHCLY
jgi:hypothetical protein